MLPFRPTFNHTCNQSCNDHQNHKTTKPANRSLNFNIQDVAAVTAERTKENNENSAISALLSRLNSIDLNCLRENFQNISTGCVFSKKLL